MVGESFYAKHYRTSFVMMIIKRSGAEMGEYFYCLKKETKMKV